MSDSATQLLAVKQGDIDAAFNLIPEQVATLKGDPHVRVEGLESLDFVYMAVTSEPEFNKALARERGSAGHRLGHRLRRHHQQHAGRHGTALRQFHSDRAVWLDQGHDGADRLSSGSGQGEGAAEEGRASRTASSSN